LVFITVSREAQRLSLSEIRAKTLDSLSRWTLVKGADMSCAQQAYSLVAQTLLDNPIAGTGTPPGTPISQPNNATTTIRLLISHGQMGGLIGKGGSKIKQIQDESGARMVASKELLPQSTERIVEVSGSTEALRLAIWEIGKALIEDYERAQGTVLFHPHSVGPEGVASGSYGGVLSSAGGYLPQRRTSAGFRGASTNGEAGPERRKPSNAAAATNGGAANVSTAPAVPTPSDPSLRTQNISIPSDMVYVPLTTWFH
jgi:heterogeneous nuclear rnp K-like protein 2